MWYVAVTIDGTVFHKTGMITGGQSETGNVSKRWEEKEVESKHFDLENILKILKACRPSTCKGKLVQSNSRRVKTASKSNSR
jgi:structural maintenance of chromosome 1